MAEPRIKYLVFDTESVADGELVSKVRFPGEGLSPDQAITRYRAELLEETGNDFIPYTFQYPATIAVAKVDADYRLVDLVALDEPHHRPREMVVRFWKGWDLYGRPTLVTFNGRTFDLPLLELAAYRYGIGVSSWFDTSGRSWDQPRNRYNLASHFDLHEFLTNLGATRFHGGLHLAASLVGRPGKMDISGYMVQDLYDAGRVQEIVDYCRCDVLDTYFVFLRTLLMQGRIKPEVEQELVTQAEAWVASRVDTVPAYRQYLEQSHPWPEPVGVLERVAADTGGEQLARTPC